MTKFPYSATKSTKSKAASYKYKSLPSHDDDEEIAMKDLSKSAAESRSSLSNNDNEGVEDERKKTNKKLVYNLNVPKSELISRHHQNQNTITTTKVVHNPLYNVDEYLNNNSKSENKNSNNNNNSPLACAKSNANRNSFLNILTKTIKRLINNDVGAESRGRQRREQRRPRLPREHFKRTKRNYLDEFRLNDIKIDLDDNKNESEIELKMKIPRRCFTKSDLEMLTEKRRIRLAMTSSDPCSSEDTCEEDKRTIQCRKTELGNLALPITNRTRQHHYTKKRASYKNIELTESQTTSLDEAHIPLYQHGGGVTHTRLNSNGLCLILLCTLCLLLNPLFGLIALMAALKSRRSGSGSTCTSSSTQQQLASSAKRIAWAGICISVTLVVAFLLTMYVTNKSVLDLVSTISAATYDTNAVSKRPQPSHKLHFWMDEMKSGEEAKGSRQTRNNYTTNSTTSTSNSITATTTAATTTTTKSRSQQSSRYYDRLSILIDHELFKSLNFNYKVSNESSL